ncbi:MAG: RNA 2',3'-cyclic phosphodiesterase, partial [Nitrosopumilus sp.]|nr:RNA 2',3'-cyclic phosphodiesterase [Nitrosopumilus sp.]
MRTFVAVEISSQQVINKISKFQSEININAKPVESENLHFTIQFLGEITEEKVSNFLIKFRGIGVFPKLKFPRVIWIGTDEDGGKALVKLAKKVEDALKPLGFVSDKPFKPHITVFRIKNKNKDIKKQLQKYELYEFGSQEITNF